MQDEPKTKTHQLEADTVYESPAIIYEGKISTRAGSPIISDAQHAPPQREVINLFPDD